jgi:hypothetical protein
MESEQNPYRREHCNKQVKGKGGRYLTKHNQMQASTRVLLKKLVHVLRQLVNKITAFYRIQRFNTGFTEFRQVSLSSVSSIYYTLFQPNN